MARRELLLALGAAGAQSACSWIQPTFASAPGSPLSPAAQALVDRAWEGLDPSRVLDVHGHVVGLGAQGSGCWVNPDVRKPYRHPLEYARFQIYLRAAGIRHEETADSEYVDRFVSFLRTQPRHGRVVLLAFDWTYDEQGNRRPDHSEFFTPTFYVQRLAREHPDCFIAAASIHPYRPDAVAELERAVGEGAVAVKWLPNAQRIDPGSVRCDPFYDKLAELSVPLLCHTGEEQAVRAEEAQLLGNPLLLRRPLERGVKVVALHAASFGSSPDLEKAGQPQVPSFDLFVRLMEETQYRGRLFGEISAVTLVNHVGRPLRELLVRTEWHERLVNGSDYPLPSINAILSLWWLERHGFLDPGDRQALSELYLHNPLQFDFVLKRSLKFESAAGQSRFLPGVFMPPPGLLRSAA